MSHRTEMDWESGVVVIRYHGTISFGELRSVLGELRAAPDMAPGQALLDDFRDAVISLSGEEMRRLAEEAAPFHRARGAGKWALLVADTATYGLARMYVAQAQGGDAAAVQVFRDPAEALAWLGRGSTGPESCRY
jgi:hypothetical protein